MSRPIDIGLQQIKTLLLKMEKLALDSLDLALKGFMNQEDVYHQIRAWSNTLLILSEELEDKATEMMALHQPMAGDLRALKAYIKIAYDIERFGRYALDISELNRSLGSWDPITDGTVAIEGMGHKVLEVLTTALKFTETSDPSLVFTLSSLESEVDALYMQNLRAISESKANAKTIIAYVLVVRYLERISDHAAYIAESVTYILTGKRMYFR
ncbi:MAG: phosphate signaling complex PhoU family protein [Candidatus Bathyarchaeia archaeon]